MINLEADLMARERAAEGWEEREQQWKTEGFRTAFAPSGSVAESFEVPGDVRAADGRRLSDVRVSVPR